MDIHRDTAAIVFYSYTGILVDGHIDLAAGASQGFINGIVYDFINKMVQGFLVRSADIHTGAPAYGLKAFQYLDVPGIISG
jgi:hypothetical protein